jgi:tRNA1Val (adenine37-N6)-methyltransferase
MKICLNTSSTYQMAHKSLQPGETLEALSCGDLSIIQRKNGYRFSIDAYLLAAFVEEKPETRILDIGSGSGVISVLLAAIKKLCVTGVEVQKDMAEMSQRSIYLAGLEDRVEIVCTDIKAYDEKRFDAIVTNPPYRPVSTGRINPEKNKAISRHEILIDLDTLMRRSYELLNPSGRFYIVYPPWRLPDLVSSMRSINIEPKRMMFVYSDMDSGPEICLVSGLKDGGKELRIERPFVIYSQHGVYTQDMQDVFTKLSLPKSH